MTSALLWCWAPWPSFFFASHSIREQIPLFMFFLERQIIIKGFSWLSYVSPRTLKLFVEAFHVHSKVYNLFLKYAKPFTSAFKVKLWGPSILVHFWVSYYVIFICIKFMPCSSPCMVFCPNSGFSSPIHMTLHITLLFLSMNLHSCIVYMWLSTPKAFLNNYLPKYEIVETL
jgi:hypothetical protein